MPALESVPAEPMLNSNNPPPPKQNHNFLAFVFLFFTLCSLLLVYLLKNPNFDFRRFLSKVTLDKTLDKNKIEISQKELDEAYQLEKLLSGPLIYPTASASASATVPEPVLKERAQERVGQRKILEIEGQKLGLDLIEIKKNSSPVGVSREGAQLTDPASARLYSYDQDLAQAVKEKVEGYVEKQVLSVLFQSPKDSAASKKVAEDILPRVQAGNFESASYLKDQPLAKGLSLFDRIIHDPLKAYPAGLPTVGQIKIAPTPFSYDLVKINKIEKGLGLSFEAWYQNAKKKYL